MPFAGRRKMLLERYLFQEMAEAMTHEMSKPNPVEEYKTEYGGSLGVPNFVPSMDNIPKDSEVLFVG
jgi:hypothetical protein